MGVANMRQRRWIGGGCYMSIDVDVEAMLTKALVDACAQNDPKSAARAAYEVFTTCDASKVLLRVVLTDCSQGGQNARKVRYCGLVIGTRSLIDEATWTFAETVDVLAASNHVNHMHPSEADVLDLMRHGELGSHYLRAESRLTPRHAEPGC